MSNKHNPIIDPDLQMIYQIIIQNTRKDLNQRFVVPINPDEATGLMNTLLPEYEQMRETGL